MAFEPVNLTLWSAPPVSSNSYGLPQWWAYSTTSDSIATVEASGYFNIKPNTLLQSTTFFVGDMIWCYCSNGAVRLYITALSPNITTAVAS
jgi:hypothetical protein